MKNRSKGVLVFMMSGFFLLLAVFALVSCGNSSSSSYSATPTTTTAAVQLVDCSTVTTPAGTVTISSSALAFNPTSTTIPANGVVKWINNDSITHTVTSGTPAAPAGTFDSTLPASASLCLKFNTVGSYQYYCKIHASMTGSVAVQ